METAARGATTSPTWMSAVLSMSTCLPESDGSVLPCSPTDVARVTRAAVRCAGSQVDPPRRSRTAGDICRSARYRPVPADGAVFGRERAPASHARRERHAMSTPGLPTIWELVAEGAATLPEPFSRPP